MQPTSFVDTVKRQVRFDPSAFSVHTAINSTRVLHPKSAADEFGALFPVFKHRELVKQEENHSTRPAGRNRTDTSNLKKLLQAFRIRRSADIRAFSREPIEVMTGHLSLALTGGFIFPILERSRYAQHAMTRAKGS